MDTHRGFYFSLNQIWAIREFFRKGTMPNYRSQLAAYGLPLPKESTPILASRPSKMSLRPRVAKPAPKPTRKTPTRLRPSPVVESANARDAMTVIAEYAKARKMIELTYRKVGDQNQVIKRICEPYSIRVKMSRHGGKRRYFYAFCANHQGIHSFIIDNIISVKGTNRRFVPRWRVEF